MSNKFTVTIRSFNKTRQTDNSNDCTIRLSCKTSYPYLQCKVLNFYVSTVDGQTFSMQSFCQLNADLDISDNFDIKQHVIAYTSLTGQGIGTTNMTFKCSNFNNKEVNFKLLNPWNDPLLSTINNVTDDYEEEWILILECEGLIN